MYFKYLKGKENEEIKNEEKLFSKSIQNMHVTTCPNACRQIALRTPSARSTGKFLLKSEPSQNCTDHHNNKNALRLTESCNNQFIA